MGVDMADTYFFGQGSLYMAERDMATGLLSGFLPFGDVSSLSLTLSGKLDHTAVSFGVAPSRFGVVPGEVMRVTAVVDNFSAANLALLLYGQFFTVPTNLHGDTIKAHVGRWCNLTHINVVTLNSVMNVAATQAYMEGADYEIDKPNGMLWINPQGLIADLQDITVHYMYGAHDIIPAGTTLPSFLYLRFNGLNVADGNKSVVVDIYKVRVRPLQQLPLIAEQFVPLVLEGDIYYDDAQVDMTLTGRWFRIRRM